MKLQAKTLYVAVVAALGGAMHRRGWALGALTLELDKTAHGKLPKDVQALYAEKDGKFVLELPEGVEAVGGLKTALEKERESRKEQERLRKELEKRFEGIDPEEVKKILDKMGSDEERQLMKDGKIDEVVNRRMAKAQQAHEKALAAEAKKTEAALARGTKFEQRVLDNHIRAAATKAGLHANAVEDALFRARTIFKLDEEGEAVQLDADGKPVLGKDSKTKFGPAEWLDGMRESASHWFPASNTGGGAGGDKNARGSGRTMKRSAFDALDPAARASTVKDGVQIVD